MEALDFTIIGGGASATAVLCQLAKVLQGWDFPRSPDMNRGHIRVVEKQDTFGPGFPHSKRNALPFHLTNMPTRDMSILAGFTEDFRVWIKNHLDRLHRHFPEYRHYLEACSPGVSPLEYVPRGVVGEYLRDRFDHAVENLRQTGLMVDLFSGWEAVDLKEQTRKILVSLRNTKTGEHLEINTERLLLATGHWGYEDGMLDGYFPSPWPPKMLTSIIPPGASVGVLGTSLSAVDTALTLTSDGVFFRRDSGELAYKPPQKLRTVTLLSRNGLFQRIRGQHGRYRNTHFTRENLDNRLQGNTGGLSLQDLYGLLNADLRKCYGRPVDWDDYIGQSPATEKLLKRYLKEAINGDLDDGGLGWQTVLHQTFPLAREIYLKLTPAERVLFDRNMKTLFFTFASPMPPVNGEKMLALMRAGVLKVERLGRDYIMEKNLNVFVFTREDANGRTQSRYDFVVDARGQKQSFETNRSALARNLIQSGTLKIESLIIPYRLQGKERDGDAYKTGAVWIEPETHRVRQAGPAGSPGVSSRIYVMGAPTRGQILDAGMVHSCARTAEWIIKDLLMHSYSMNCGFTG